MSDEVARKVRDFFSQYPEKKFIKQQIIVQTGDEPAGIFYMLEGRVSQYDISPTGAEVVVNVFQPPAFFPMSWAINKTPNQYFFEASSDVVARQAPPDDVVEFLRGEPDVLFDLLSRVYRGSDGLLRRLAHLMGGGARSRLVFEILNAARRFGEHSANGSVNVPLKEGDLAKHSGLARETVNRVIQNLKTEGLVEVNKDGLTVPDMKSLEASLGTGL
jgi:CRP/FNR family transcriptional regulator